MGADAFLQDLWGKAFVHGHFKFRQFRSVEQAGRELAVQIVPGFEFFWNVVPLRE